MAMNTWMKKLLGVFLGVMVLLFSLLVLQYVRARIKAD